MWLSDEPHTWQVLGAYTTAQYLSVGIVMLVCVCQDTEQICRCQCVVSKPVNYQERASWWGMYRENVWFTALLHVYAWGWVEQTLNLGARGAWGIAGNTWKLNKNFWSLGDEGRLLDFAKFLRRLSLVMYERVGAFECRCQMTNSSHNLTLLAQTISRSQTGHIFFIPFFSAPVYGKKACRIARNASGSVTKEIWASQLPSLWRCNTRYWENSRQKKAGRYELAFVFYILHIHLTTYYLMAVWLSSWRWGTGLWWLEKSQ